jgi:large subunit ribosomal protein L10
MPNAEKMAAVTAIKEEVEAADAMWVVDYRGLTVKESEELRHNIREQQASYKIYKNTLTKRALHELDYPAMDDMLEGPSAFIFASGDPAPSAKVLKNFAKEHEVLQIKGGLLNGAVMDVDKVKAIADLPSREELYAKLLGTLLNPVQGIVSVLNAVPQAAVTALDALAKQKAAN